jgi:hypothetical protein
VVLDGEDLCGESSNRHSMSGTDMDILLLWVTAVSPASRSGWSGLLEVLDGDRHDRVKFVSVRRVGLHAATTAGVR